jgi:putative DNA primase/helicase
MLKKDKAMPAALLEELPGILAWAVRGCTAWQRDGLPLPEAIQRATGEYRQEMDTIGTWMEERCERRPSLRTSPAALFNDYVVWSSDKTTYNANSFGRELTTRGLERSPDKRWVLGIGLVSEDFDRGSGQSFDDEGVM